MDKITRKDAIENYKYLDDLFTEYLNDIDGFLRFQLFKFDGYETKFKKNLFEITKRRNSSKIELNLILNFNSFRHFIHFNLDSLVIEVFSLKDNLKFVREQVRNILGKTNLEITKFENKIEALESNISNLEKEKNELKKEVEKYKNIDDNSFKEKCYKFFNKESPKVKANKEYNTKIDELEDLKDDLKTAERDLDIQRNKKSTFNHFDERYLNELFFKNKINEMILYLSNEYVVDYKVIYR